MSKTHTKINQLVGDKLKGFAYANTTDKELVDDNLATRDETNGYTEIARIYNSLVQDITYSGIGSDNLVVNSADPANNYTVTINNPFQSLRTLNNDALIDNDAIFTNASISDSTFAIQTDNNIAYLSTPETVVSGTFINGEQIFGNLGFSGFYISYNGTDFVYSYTITAPITGEIITGNNSGATITIGGTETSLGKETFTWSESDKASNLLGGGLLVCEMFPQTIGTVNTVDVQFGFTVGHQANGQYIFFNGTGVPLAVASNLTGTIADGEILTGSVSGSTFKVWTRNYGQDFAYVTQLTGTYSAGETLVGSTGSLELNLIQLVGDSVSITDGTITENNKAIIIGPTFNDSEAIVFNGGDLDIYFSNDFPFQTPYRVVGDVWTITNAPTTITTGYESNQVQFPNTPSSIESSALVSTDGTDKVAIGVFDLVPFGGNKLTAGIVSLYGDGSQSTFTTNKGFSQMDISDVSTGKQMNVEYSGDRFRVSGFNGSNSFRQSIDGNNFRYRTNSINCILPNQLNVPGSVFTDVNGDGVITLEPPITIPGVLNGITNIGPDIGLGGTLSQNTDITTNPSGNYFNISGNDNSTNIAGIAYFPSGLNTLSGYAGAYSDTSGENKAGVYTSGVNSFYAVIGYYDASLSIPNASHTIHYHNKNIGTSSRNVRLVSDSSNNVVYNKVIEIDGSNFIKNESAVVNNTFSTAYGFEYNSVIDTLSNIYQDVLRNTVSGTEFTNNTNFSTNTKSSSVTDGTNTHTLEQNQFGLKTTLRQFADDAAAGLGGLIAGEIYQTDGTGAAPLNVAGIVMIKQ